MSMKHVSVTEAAAILGVQRATVIKQIRAGRLKAEMVGKTYILETSELDRYSDEQLGRKGRKVISI